MDDTERAILEAPYRTLCEHGYADPTMQRIADESRQSKPAIHSRYGSTERLLESFLDCRYERYPERLDWECGEGGTHARQVAVWHPARHSSETTRTYIDTHLVGENPSAVIA